MPEIEIPLIYYDFFNNQSTVYTQTNIQERKLNQIFFGNDIFKQKDTFAFFLFSILELLKNSSVQLILKFDEPPQSWIGMLKPLTDFFKSVSENAILCTMFATLPLATIFEPITLPVTNWIDKNYTLPLADSLHNR
jgi:hypothetical protein